MRATVLGALLASAVIPTGCIRSVVNEETMTASRTVADLQYDQVLYNLAATQGQAWAVPSQVAFQSGQIQVADTITPGGSITWPSSVSGYYQTKVASLTGSRQLTENWVVVPVRGKELKRVQGWYQWAVQREAASQPRDVRPVGLKSFEDFSAVTRHLRTFGLPALSNHVKENPAATTQTSPLSLEPPATQPAAEPPPPSQSATLTLNGPGSASIELPGRPKAVSPDQLPRQGWYHVGKPVGKPRYVGRYGDLTVWIDKDHEPDLAKFTLLVLDEVSSAPLAVPVQGGTAINP